VPEASQKRQHNDEDEDDRREQPASSAHIIEEDEDDDESEGPELYRYDSDGSEIPHEDAYRTDFKPSYETANKLNFYPLCEKLENLDKMQRDRSSLKRKLSKEEKLKYLLPPPLLARIKPGSMFPLFRLLMPNKDSSRQTITKQGSLATAYSAALGFARGSVKFDALKNYTDPTAVTRANFGKAGDFSVVVEAAVRDRANHPPSKTKIRHINKVLDDLVAGIAASRKNSKGTSGSNQSQQWRSSQTQSQATQGRIKPKSISQSKVREEFVRTLVNGLKLLPLEHKWLVRILLEDIKIGVGEDQILHWYSPHAVDLWKSHNSMRAVCDLLNSTKWQPIQIQ
jgi:DNA ligase 4